MHPHHIDHGLEGVAMRGATGLFTVALITSAVSIGTANTAVALDPGDPLSVSGYDTAGEPWSLADTNGVTVLHMCTVWCSPCRSVIDTWAPDLDARTDVAHTAIDILVQDLSGNPATQTTALGWQSLNGGLPVIHPGGEPEGTSSIAAFNTAVHGGPDWSFPTWVVVDAAGKYVGHVVGVGGDFVGEVAELVERAAPAGITASAAQLTPRDHANPRTPVVLYGTPEFDVTTVDVATVATDGVPVAAHPTAYLDHDDDGVTDLLVHAVVENPTTLTATTTNGISVTASIGSP